MMNVAEFILSKGKDTAEAVISKDEVLDYRELRRRVRQVAEALIADGHRKGDRVAIWSENNPFFVTAYLGIIRAGLVAVPLQTDLTTETLDQIAAETEIQKIFVSRRYLNRLRNWAQKAGVKLVSEGQGADPPSERTSPFFEIDPACDLAALMFTSGSTGAPKGVMVTHRNIECNSRDILAYMGLSAADRVMAVLPLHYCFGVSLLHTHLLAGGTVVLNNDFKLYPEAMLQEMKLRECTGLAGVPSTYQLLLRKTRFCELEFPSLRWFQQAGGKLPNACIAELIAGFPQVRYFLMYGQTEATARLSYLPPERLADKLGSIGRGLPSTNLDVLKPDGTCVAPGSSEVGEIVASGDNITLGYWRDPVETAKFFRNGRLLTGDLARVDADGFIFIVERERDMIKSGGNRVSAKEVEDVIAELREVVEVAVVGVPHELLGEAILAFVVSRPGSNTSEADIIAHSRRRLPAFKVPTAVTLTSALPHNTAGKVMKQELKRRALHQLPANPTTSPRDGETSPVRHCSFVPVDQP
jgi:long-chain acyl-CoA synthetase